MGHYKKMFDRSFLAAFDLTNEAGDPIQATVTIEAVEQGQIQSPGKPQKRRAPVLKFANREKRLILNSTNASTIARLYGVNVEGWPGRKISLYPTTTTFGRDKNVPCIRVKPEVPPARSRPTPEQARPPVEVVAELTARQPPAEADTETPQDPPEWDREP